jgi:hypothetical protein
MLTRIVFTCIIIVTLLPRALGQSDIKAPLYIDLSKTHGFCLGQQFSIEHIQQQFPELAAQATKAQLEFDLVFQPAYENIRKILYNLAADKMQESENQLRNLVADKFKASPVSKQDALAFINLVSLRAKGKIDSPFLETLLIYHPEFEKDPALEYMQGFTQTYQTKGHPKAMGINFQIQYPKSWEAKEADRPNTIQMITSENGRGFNYIALMVRDIALPKGYKMTQAEIKEIFAPKSLQTTIPKGGTFISAKSVVLDGRQGGMIIFDQDVQRLDVTVKFRNIQFVTFYNNKLIMIHCASGTSDNTTSSLEAKFKKVESLFKLVGNSFVLQNQYQ